MTELLISGLVSLAILPAMMIIGQMGSLQEEDKAKDENETD